MRIIKQNNRVDTNSYYELMHIKSVPNKVLYKTFVNWVSGEFELFLQDKLNGLKIFFPSGYFSITESETNNTDVNFKIIVRSKSKQKGIQISTQINAVLNHLLKLKYNSYQRI